MDDERRNPIDFGSQGSKVKVNFGTLWHDSDYSFLLNHFQTSHVSCDDEWRKPIDFGSRVIGQGQLCPPARGCHALRCLVCILNTVDLYTKKLINYIEKRYQMTKYY